MAPKKYQTNTMPPSTNLPGLIDHAVKVMNLIQHELKLNPQETQLYQDKIATFTSDLMGMKGNEIQRKIEVTRDESIIHENVLTTLEYENMSRQLKRK